MGGRVVGLNENITTSAPIELGLGLGLSLAICIHFAFTKVHFVILYRSFLTVLIAMNVCTILAECILMLYTLKTHTNVPQQNEHELQNLA